MGLDLIAEDVEVFRRDHAKLSADITQLKDEFRGLRGELTEHCQEVVKNIKSVAEATVPADAEYSRVVSQNKQALMGLKYDITSVHKESVAVAHSYQILCQSLRKLQSLVPSSSSPHSICAPIYDESPVDVGAEAEPASPADPSPTTIPSSSGELSSSKKLARAATQVIQKKSKRGLESKGSNNASSKISAFSASSDAPVGTSSTDDTGVSVAASSAEITVNLNRVQQNNITGSSRKGIVENSTSERSMKRGITSPALVGKPKSARRTATPTTHVSPRPPSVDVTNSRHIDNMSPVSDTSNHSSNSNNSQRLMETVPIHFDRGDSLGVILQDYYRPIRYHHQLCAQLIVCGYVSNGINANASYRAGILVDDVIFGVNGTTYSTSEELSSALIRAYTQFTGSNRCVTEEEAPDPAENVVNLMLSARGDPKSEVSRRRLHRAESLAKTKKIVVRHKHNHGHKGKTHQSHSKDHMHKKVEHVSSQEGNTGNSLKKVVKGMMRFVVKRTTSKKFRKRIGKTLRKYCCRRGLGRGPRRTLTHEHSMSIHARHSRRPRHESSILSLYSVQSSSANDDSNMNESGENDQEDGEYYDDENEGDEEDEEEGDEEDEEEEYEDGEEGDDREVTRTLHHHLLSEQE
jgi:hypothetical protein